MVRNTIAALLVAALTFPPLALVQAEPSADFRAVIRSQLDAFLADDFATAFTFAAPGIQGVFRTPDAFGRMVREGYPMVWRPADVQFLDLQTRDDGVWQRVLITDAAGATHVLDYQMINTPDGLRIGAVKILPATGVGA